MVPVAAHVLEVVVLAADAQALLAVGDRGCAAVSVPRKTCLNCTMPALVKSRLGSLAGTSGALGTMVCPRARKKSRKPLRIWSPVTREDLSAVPGGGNPRGGLRLAVERRRRTSVPLEGDHHDAREDHGAAGEDGPADRLVEDEP